VCLALPVYAACRCERPQSRNKQTNKRVITGLFLLLVYGCLCIGVRYRVQVAALFVSSRGNKPNKRGAGETLAS
jgi:hypothetical protein